MSTVSPQLWRQPPSGVHCCMCLDPLLFTAAGCPGSSSAPCSQPLREVLRADPEQGSHRLPAAQGARAQCDLAGVPPTPQLLSGHYLPSGLRVVNWGLCHAHGRTHVQNTQKPGRPPPGQDTHTASPGGGCCPSPWEDQPPLVFVVSRLPQAPPAITCADFAPCFFTLVLSLNTKFVQLPHVTTVCSLLRL